MKEFNPTHKGISISPRIIIGIGNPGEKYENTYHNAGMLFVKDLISIFSDSQKLHSSKKFYYIKSGLQIFVCSNVFMNESGIATQAVLHFFKETPEHLLVAHDDSDLLIGTYKIDFGKSSAGHNGISSIIEMLGTKNFYRLRIGIRKPQRSSSIKREKASEFVLKKITREDKKILSQIFTKFKT
jgi:PTH1 family peptidyl-tRNA hydrolase